MDALKSKSSIVAVKVASFPSHCICVITLLVSLTVLTLSPMGVLKLSGETAWAMAFAVFSSAYSSVIVASKFLALQLFTNQFVHSFNEPFNLVKRNLRACSDVVSSAFASMRF